MHRPLVLLPGMDGSGELFDDFVAQLDADIEPLVQRYAADEPLGYEALARRVAAELPRERPYAILGESFSGPLAIMLAATALPQPRALILSCSFARSPVPGLSQTRSLVDLVPIDLLPKRWIVDYFLGDTQDERLAQRLLKVSERLTPTVWRARVKAAMAADVTAHLRGLKMPILYLRARHDRLVAPLHAQVIQQFAPQTQIVDFDTPHFLLQAAPARAARIVAEFLRAHADTAAD